MAAISPSQSTKEGPLRWPSPFCAIVGPATSQASQGVAVLSRSYRVPQIAYATTDSKLGNVHSFPNLIRTTIDVNFLANAVAQYIQRPGYQRNYVALLHDKGESSVLMITRLESSGRKAKMTSLFAVPFATNAPNDKGLKSAIKSIAESGFRTILFITEQTTNLPRVARVAQLYGLLGPGYLWIFAGTSLPTAYLQSLDEQPQSPMDKLLQGAAVFRLLDPFRLTGQLDPLYHAMSTQFTHQNIIQRLADLHPLSNQTAEYFHPPHAYFQSPDFLPPQHASFIYDSVMAVGLAACRWKLNQSQTNTHADSLQTLPHLAAIINIQFHGASGHVSFINTPDRGRNPNGLFIGMENIQPTQIHPTSGKQSYKSVLTSVYENGQWRDLPSTSFLYPGGGTTPPMPLRDPADENFLSPGVRAVGLALLTIAYINGFGCALWVFNMRNVQLVRSAQPLFLVTLCMGSVIMSTSIFLNSFDESYGWSKRQLDIVCAFFPWFFIMGYIIVYGAVFSKLWRVNRLFQVRRQQVKPYQVIWPFALLCIITFILLITWSFISPPSWNRVVVSEQPLVTTGLCTRIDIGPDSLWMVGIYSVLFLATALTFVMAWRTKDIQEEFSESKWVFYGIYTHLQTWAVGAPLFYIMGEISKDASYLASTMLLFILSTSFVVVVIWPKIVKSAILLYCPGRQEGGKRNGVHISVTTNHRNSQHSRDDRVRISGLGDVSLPLPSNKTRMNTSSEASASRYPSTVEGMLNNNSIISSSQAIDVVHDETQPPMMYSQPTEAAIQDHEHDHDEREIARIEGELERDKLKLAEQENLIREKDQMLQHLRQRFQNKTHDGDGSIIIISRDDIQP